MKKLPNTEPNDIEKADRNLITTNEQLIAYFEQFEEHFMISKHGRVQTLVQWLEDFKDEHDTGVDLTDMLSLERVGWSVAKWAWVRI